MQPNEMDWASWDRAMLKQIGSAVKSAREKSGLSQRALADAAGIDRGQIVNLESEGRTSELPRVGLLVRIAVALDVPPTSLLYPGVPDAPVELLPSVTAHAFEAVRWWAGEIEDEGAAWKIFHRSRELHSERRALAAASELLNKERFKDLNGLLDDESTQQVNLSTWLSDSSDAVKVAEKEEERAERRVRELTAEIRELGGVVDDA
ncbi:helix-turn-helix domain-containing protein [Antrihabitans sp. NCIMB 15449]|uniref:Helix-turn-helix domain-containing protein n=1 Tax=Antrihabitans spumae TaxID=3373370 RepID=A0ABW7JN21_9NOCA